VPAHQEGALVYLGDPRLQSTSQRESSFLAQKVEANLAAPGCKSAQVPQWVQPAAQVIGNARQPQPFALILNTRIVERAVLAQPRQRLSIEHLSHVATERLRHVVKLGILVDHL
jgi:hypothetical protein